MNRRIGKGEKGKGSVAAIQKTTSDSESAQRSLWRLGMETRVWESGRLGQPPLFTIPLPGKPQLTAYYLVFCQDAGRHTNPKLDPN